MIEKTRGKNTFFVIRKKPSPYLFLSKFLFFFFQSFELSWKRSIGTLLDKWQIFIWPFVCGFNRRKTTKRGLVARPILSHHMNSRFQVDLTDMQSELDGYYRFIMNYQDHLTKFTILPPLKSRTSEEVSHHLMDIFCMFDVSLTPQSDNGSEFANKIIQTFADMWPGKKLVHGKPRYS